MVDRVVYYNPDVCANPYEGHKTFGDVPEIKSRLNDLAKNVKEYNMENPSSRLREMHNKRVFDVIRKEIRNTMNAYKPPKLQVETLALPKDSKDGSLKIVLKMEKPSNDPNTFLKLIRGLNKVLREHEEEILNG